MSTIGYYICVPFAWLVRLFYNLTNSYGVALILFTLVIKLIMLPFQMKSKKSMMRMSRVSGQMQELQKRYAKNQAKLQEEMQKLYEEEGVNPMSGCLWSFIPILFLMVLYGIIREPLTYFMGLVIFYALINWMPVLFKDAGIAPARAAFIAAMLMLCCPLLSAVPRPYQRSPSCVSTQGDRPWRQALSCPFTTSPCP